VTTPASGLWRPVAVLMSGTALAQAVPVLLSPVLTRLYSPEAYGALAWAVSLVTVAVLLAGAAYDQAVSLPADRAEAAALVVGMVRLGAVASVLLLAAGIGEFLLFNTRSHRLWFVPAATGLTVIFNACSAFATREARFPTLVRARVALALGTAAATLGFGLGGAGEAGLLGGNLLGLVAGCAVIGAATWRADGPLLRAVGGPAIRAAWRTHRNCPLYLLPSSLLNTVTNQLPVWFLGRLFGAAPLGQYALMNRVLGVPLGLVGSSVGDVFKSQAAAEFRATGGCARTFGRFARGLGLAALAPTLALLVAGPDLFAFVFGEPWRTAGRYAQLLAVLFAFRFAVSPLSYVVIIAGRARLDLILQGLCLLAAVAGWAAGVVSGSAETALLVFGTLYSVVYLLYLGFSYRLAHRP
jgi:O-antigen/teichoic acid export membrane protein